MNTVAEEVVFNKYYYQIIHYLEDDKYCLYYTAKYHFDLLATYDSKQKCLKFLHDRIQLQIINDNKLIKEIEGELI